MLKINLFLWFRVIIQTMAVDFNVVCDYLLKVPVNLPGTDK